MKKHFVVVFLIAIIITSCKKKDAVVPPATIQAQTLLNASYGSNAKHKSTIEINTRRSSCIYFKCTATSL